MAVIRKTREPARYGCGLHQVVYSFCFQGRHRPVGTVWDTAVICTIVADSFGLYGYNTTQTNFSANTMSTKSPCILRRILSQCLASCRHLDVGRAPTSAARARLKPADALRSE